MKNFYSIKLEPFMGTTMSNCIKEAIELAEFTKFQQERCLVFSQALSHK